MIQRDYWDSVAEQKEFTLPFPHQLFSFLVSRNARILDVGCGYGRTLHELSLHGYANLTGVDFSSAMVERGRRVYPDLRLMVAEGSVLPFEPASFDAVILFAVITGNSRDTDQDAIIEEISRILRPGGILCFNDFLLNDDQRNLERYARYADTYGTYGVFELPDGGIARHHTPERIAELVSGFTRLHYEETVFTTMNGNRSRGFTFIGRR